MKKYLMTGIAALALCVGFTSCSHDLESLSQEEIDQMQAQKIIDNYNKAFKAYIGGEIASTQTWGFGSLTSTRTRGTAPSGYDNGYVGAYPDANMWTSYGYLAPDPLTKSQHLRAQYYFQMNHIVNPNTPDYGQIDFFIQQVYDGGDDPMTGKSLEKYLAADESTYITSGEHMDHLTAGPDHTHIYNFNNGNCSTNGNVADRDQTDVNDTDKQHSDEIQLMLNTKTSCFGYANSDASCVRDDRWTLVSAVTIDNFCDNDPGFAAWLSTRLPQDEQDVKCDDDFHRSYIGFDFDMLPDESIFAGTEHWEYGLEQYNYQPHYLGKTYAADDYYYLNGKSYHYVSANRNQYCGESQTIDPEPQGEAALALLNDGWLPVKGSADKTWVKVGGCADGYYSDWIVTFMPADSGDNPDPDTYKVRIMAEDLSATEASDFDFNDVVIDVVYTTDQSTATITLRAAGGTLPLRINGDDTKEVHSLFGVGTNVMVNTGWGGSNGASKDPVSFPISFTLIDKDNDGEITEDDFLLTVKEIKLEVKKTLSSGAPGWFEMKAEQGEPASKFAIPLEDPTVVNWCSERTSIKDTYEYFVDWARTGAIEFKWW